MKSNFPHPNHKTQLKYTMPTQSYRPESMRNEIFLPLNTKTSN